MKKLMMAAAIAFSVAVGQAATVSWNLTNVKKDGTGVDGIMYVIVDANLARSTVLGLAGQGATKISSTLSAASAYAFEWAVAAGVGTLAKGASGQPSVEDLGMTEGGTYSLYAVCFDTDEITDKSNFYVTALKSGQKMGTGTADKNVYFGSQATGSAESGAWMAVAAPEPTSGLLLLLGMAGLALRRRRA